MPKTIQKVVTVAVAVALENEAQQYSNDEITNMLIIKSADKKNIKIKSYVADEQPA